MPSKGKGLDYKRQQRLARGRNRDNATVAKKMKVGTESGLVIESSPTGTNERGLLNAETIANSRDTNGRLDRLV